MSFAEDNNHSELPDPADDEEFEVWAGASDDPGFLRGLARLSSLTPAPDEPREADPDVEVIEEITVTRPPSQEELTKLVREIMWDEPLLSVWRAVFAEVARLEREGAGYTAPHPDDELAHTIYKAAEEIREAMRLKAGGAP
jgi:hypothetical protein